MALIRCNECGHEVSDKTSTYPNCGSPISNPTQKNYKRWGKKVAIGCWLLVIPILMLFEFECFVCIFKIKEGLGVLLSYLFFGITFALLNWYFTRWVCKKFFSLESRRSILRFCGFILIGIAMVGIPTGLLYELYGDRIEYSSFFNYSDAESINEAIRGTVWQSSGKGNDVEIYFSNDGKSAKFRINRYENDYEKPDSIVKKYIDIDGRSGSYVLIYFSEGVFALSNDKNIHTAMFAPIVTIPTGSSYDYVGTSLQSITKGVQEGAYAAALAALNYSGSSEKVYGGWIDMIKLKKDK